VCVNFAPTTNTEWVKESFGVDLPPSDLQGDPQGDPHDQPAETYPGLVAPLIVRSRRSGRIACGLARFGLIPAWAKDQTIGRHTYNARCETVAQKPSYRTAWAQGQFGLVPIDHFFEPNYESGKAVRWKIAVSSNAPFALAGLWAQWRDPATQQTLASFSVLTVNADHHPVMNRFHKAGDEKRMPVIVPAPLYQTWLAADEATARKVIEAAMSPSVQAVPAPKGG
jgi:putative SOS response-associated peptidase YedK